ncbi:MAG: hypothetical protein ABR570_04875 [Burkholderiales bacterium]
MAAATRIHDHAGCVIEEENGLLRANVGPGLAEEVQRCYRALATACVTGQCTRVLIIGHGTLDPFYHLAGRDALRSMALAGVAANFRLALVAKSAGLIAVYDAAVVEAGRHNIDARRFMTEEEAEGWLKG